MLAGVQREPLKGPKQVCLWPESGSGLIVLGTRAWLWARITSLPGVAASLRERAGVCVESLHHARVLHSLRASAIAKGGVGVIRVAADWVVRPRCSRPIGVERCGKRLLDAAAGARVG